MRPSQVRSRRPVVRFLMGIGALVALNPVESRAGGLIPWAIDPNRPYIRADGSLTYDASTGDFNVQAAGLFFASNNLPGGNTQVPIAGGAAVIDLTVDKSGNLLSVGSLTLTGSIDLDQDGTADVGGTLLTGEVTQFGAAAAGPAPWEFDGLITITGGALTQSSVPLSGGGSFSDLFAVGEVGGFDLVVGQQVSGTLGDFMSSFNGSSIKGPVFGASLPEPSSLALCGLGLLALSGYARRLGGCGSLANHRALEPGKPPGDAS